MRGRGACLREVLPDRNAPLDNAAPLDALLSGLHVSNSETWARSLAVDAVAYRLVCANGMVAPAGRAPLLRRRHVGGGAPLADDLRRAVGPALDRGETLLGRLRRAARTPLPDPEGAVEALAGRGVPAWVRADVRLALAATPGGHSHTLYGLLNAMTLAAQGLPPDARYALEALAGLMADRETGAAANGPAPTPGLLTPSALAAFPGGKEGTDGDHAPRPVLAGV